MDKNRLTSSLKASQAKPVGRLFAKAWIWFFPLFAAVLITGCQNFLFYPQKNIVQTPDELGIDYRQTVLESSDGTPLVFWILSPKTPKRGSVLQLHGNAENISTHFRSAVWLLDYGFEVIAFDYRGYGRSGGKAEFPEILEDSKKAIEFLAGRKNGQKFVLGQSLGGALSIYVLAKNPILEKEIEALILDAPFSGYSSITRDVLQSHWLTWLLAYPASWTMPGREYDPLTHINDLNIPVLHFHSEEDRVIPISHAYLLSAGYGDGDRFIKTRGRHIETFAFSKYRQETLIFLEGFPFLGNTPELVSIP